jgi:hypothetical protein
MCKIDLKEAELTSKIGSMNYMIKQLSKVLEELDRQKRILEKERKKHNASHSTPDINEGA